MHLVLEGFLPGKELKHGLSQLQTFSWEEVWVSRLLEAESGMSGG